MNLWSRTKRARSIAGIITAIAGSGQAPPPADMPDYLRQQYGEYGKTRNGELGRDIKRLTTKSRQPATGLDRRAARDLRGDTK